MSYAVCLIVHIFLCFERERERGGGGGGGGGGVMVASKRCKFRLAKLCKMDLFYLADLI
jgi:hypothetical protein